MSLKNPVTPPGIDPGTVRLVAQCLNLYANPGPQLSVKNNIIEDVHKGKDKGHPATGPRGSGEVKASDFLDVWHYKGGRSSAIRTGHLYPRRNPWYLFSRAESTQGTTFRRKEPRKKSPVTPPAIDPGTVRLVAQCLKHYATPGPREDVHSKVKW